MLPGFGLVATIVPSVCLMKYCGRSIASVNWPRSCILDGSLKLAGFDPLPSDIDRGPALVLSPPALHICGFKDGKVTLPAGYHTWEKAAHLAESFDMVRQRWLQPQHAEEESTPSLVKRRRSDEPMERSPAVGGCAPDGIRNVGSS